MHWQGRPLGLCFSDLSTAGVPRVGVTAWSGEVLSSEFLTGLERELDYRYNLSLDLASFNARFAGDERLAPILARWRGMRPMNPGSLYDYLIIAIVLQNAVIHRSVQMLQSLFEAYGASLAFDDRELSCFWEPADLAGVSEEDLRRLKVGYRAKSIQRVTAAFTRSEIDEMALRQQNPATQRQALLSLYGIGPASVGYILFDVFHLWDELEHISPWEQKIYSKLFFDVDPETPLPVSELLAYFSQHFGGYRMLAVHYVWEDLFWRWHNELLDWLQKLIRR